MPKYTMKKIEDVQNDILTLLSVIHLHPLSVKDALKSKNTLIHRIGKVWMDLEEIRVFTKYK